MENRKSKVWLVLAIIGLLLLAGGTTLIVLSFTVNVPSMSDSGWFDAKTQQNGMLFGGIVMIMFGFTITVMSIVSKKSNSFRQNLISRVENNGQEQNGLVEIINNLGKPQKRICTYCGTENSEGATKCSSCGAGLSTKK